ncbi:hypothetical protein BE04_21310 [Sorangium cellulosum]|uniref:Uncharacterized protein n=2 Tax=Sorangium cellulosum TaxID=56 RepID=A0A150P1X3_SORCE|nr:hypothetical protein SCE1572_05150 [Sorangium cellulosum So0157-2]KYF49262.1 hypothetical protein BE04_21310 [Sorangium cellulosum]KYG01812.1 hypothetical protein BE21_55970 [Sorangium cellulosum]
MQARTSFSSIPCSEITSWTDMPLVRRSITSDDQIRCLQMQGWPRQTFGATKIRSREGPCPASGQTQVPRRDESGELPGIQE